MTTIYKSASDTSVALLSTVGTIANTISGTVTTVAKSMDMLDMFIETAHTKQKQRTIVDLSNFTDQLIEDSAIENSERQIAILDKLASNASLKSLYTTNEAKLRALLNPIPSE